MSTRRIQPVIEGAATLAGLYRTVLIMIARRAIYGGRWPRGGLMAPPPARGPYARSGVPEEGRPRPEPAAAREPVLPRAS